MLRIEMVFSEKLLKSVDNARKSGEKVSLDSVLRKLKDTYARELKGDPVFLRTLKSLDPNVEVRVIIAKLGGKNGASENRH